MASWYNIQDDFHRSNDNWWKKIVKGLNNALNPYHAWFDYDKWNEETVLDKALGSVSNLLDHVANPDVATSLVDKYTGAHLTGAENEANAFSAAEAQKSRDFTEYMARNKYAMETASMQDAGVNPAMVYGGGNLVPTASNGATAASVSPQTGDIGDLIMSIVRMPAELAKLRAEAKRANDEGQAAKENAESNRINAAANQQNAQTAARNAATAERQATVAEMRQQVDAAMAESNMSVNDATLTHIAKQCSILDKQLSQMDEILDISKRQVSAQERQALASLKQAAAAVQNAATNDYLSNYQSSLLWAQELLTWAEGEGKEIVNKYLDDNQKQTLENLRKEGLVLDEQKRLVHKQGNLADAQTVRTYVNCATDVFNTASRFVGIGALKDVGGNIVNAQNVNDFTNALNMHSLGQQLRTVY